MIDLGKVRNYYIACGYTDLRFGIDGLAAVVTQPFGGHLDEESLFFFCGKRTDRINALYWSGDGYILLYKRLSNGRFQRVVHCGCWAHARRKWREAYRQNVVLPLLEEYFAWLKTVHPEKGSKLEDTVRYSLNQKQAFCAFLDHGGVSISNNLAENAIRPFVVGRKTGYSATASRAQNPAPSSTRWWRRPKQTELSLMSTCC